MAYLMGIDVATTSVKALLMDAAGKVTGTATTGHPLSNPKPLWCEQNATDWWDGSVGSIRKVLEETGTSGDDVAAVGLAGQMHGLTLLGEKGDVLRQAILWSDQRTAAQCDEIRQRVGRRRLIEITGNDALAGFTAPKILWVREHEPDVYARVRHVLLPEDYVRFKLTGEYAASRAGAAGTLLVDIKTRDWSAEVLGALDIPMQWLPRTHEGPEITGRVSKEAALATGLKAGTPVVAGGGDQSAQAVGVGAVRPGVLAVTMGTSGVVFASTLQPFVEPEGRLHAFCHAVPGRWHLMGVMLSAAGSLRWFRDTLAPDADYDSLLTPAGAVAPGSEGLLFLPYLSGERTPYPDPLARGAFVGLTLRHARPHMVRSVLEGVAFGIRDMFELTKTTGMAQVSQVRVSGGGSRSPLWRQIIADVLNVELATVSTTEGAAYGAALLAGVGVGIWRDVDEACRSAVTIVGKAAPEATHVAEYDRLYRSYCQLYPALKDVFHRLGGG